LEFVWTIGYFFEPLEEPLEEGGAEIAVVEGRAD